MADSKASKTAIALASLAGFFVIPYSIRKAAVYSREHSEKKAAKKATAGREKEQASGFSSPPEINHAS